MTARRQGTIDRSYLFGAASSTLNSPKPTPWARRIASGSHHITASYSTATYLPRYMSMYKVCSVHTLVAIDLHYLHSHHYRRARARPCASAGVGVDVAPWAILSPPLTRTHARTACRPAAAGRVFFSRHDGEWGDGGRGSCNTPAACLPASDSLGGGGGPSSSSSSSERR